MKKNGRIKPITIFFVEFHVPFGARNLLLEPHLHKKNVHPTLSDDGHSENSSSSLPKKVDKTKKRKVALPQNFFAKRKGVYHS